MVCRVANIVSSHGVSKLKTNDDRSLQLKAGIVLHGNGGSMKDEIRKDCMAADMQLTRLIVSPGVLLRFGFAVTDIKGAFMKMGRSSGSSM